MFNIDPISNIKKMLSVFQVSKQHRFEVVELHKQESLDLFFYDKILSIAQGSISPNLTLKELREMESYPCYLVKKRTFGPNESKAILFDSIGQTLGEFTLIPNLIKAQQSAEIVASLAA